MPGTELAHLAAGCEAASILAIVPNGCLTDCPSCPCSCPPQSDYISFRHHTYEMPKGVKSVALKECGPRFEMKLYQVGGWADGWVGGWVGGLQLMTLPHARPLHLAGGRMAR